MVGQSLAAFLVLVPILANVGGTIGFSIAPTTGSVTRVLSQGITETIRPLSEKEHDRAGKRDNVDLTGADCASTCGGVAGTGPNQADCNQLIAALDVEDVPTFIVGPYTVANWVQASCTIEFVQSTADTITYTYTYLGAVASYLSDTCNAANGYAYGNCIFDGREDAIWVGNTAVGIQ